MLDLSEKKTNQKLVYSSNSLLKSNNDFKRSNKKKNSYKEQALEKINLSPLQTKLKYPNDKMTFSKEKFEKLFFNSSFFRFDLLLNIFSLCSKVKFVL